ncbi:MAG TPA: 3-hydroxyacyl-CoA dehydrogenase family protein [Ohtaekwangia sp.]|nr:3-hydroxyacyl-CoA dehydrogenase family protein [Ohtaekwangia sp.]
MKILIIGEDINFQESHAKFGGDHQYVLVAEHRDAEKFLTTYDLILDFIIDQEPHRFEIYADKSVTVFINTAKISLAELSFMLAGGMKAQIFGFNGMPTFLNRPVMEVSVRVSEDETALKLLCSTLKTEFLIVDDRVGMVTPRVICMIINEAYFTAQEGTATREDIDKAMKLGTNYPYGPFEWCQRIGVKHVYELLEAVYEDTRDERYKICPLLKKEYLKNSA